MISSGSDIKWQWYQMAVSKHQNVVDFKWYHGIDDKCAVIVISKWYYDIDDEFQEKP